MILVFILLGIIIFILTILFLILISTFHIEIRDLEITNIGTANAPGYAIILSLYLANKIKWISIHLNDEKMRKMYNRMHLEKIDFKKFEQNFKWKDLKIAKKIQPKLSYLSLNMKIGLESPVITAFLVSVISSIIAIGLPYVATNLIKENYEYYIQPIYHNKNIYKIQLNCIIQVKMVHIINVIYIFLKKRRRDLNERSTSNRRAYGYSYE